MSRTALVRIFVLFSAIALIGARPALAQDRGTVGGQAGVTFQTEIAPVVGGEVSVNVLPMLQVYGTLGRMTDTLPRELQDLFDAVDPSLDLSLPTVYGMGGVKAIAPTGPVRPYGVFGAGFARLSGKIEYAGADITDEALDFVELERSDLRSTKLAFELGGGVMIPLGRAFVEGGYRYMRVTGMDHNVSRVYGGGGFRF